VVRGVCQIVGDRTNVSPVFFLLLSQMLHVNRRRNIQNSVVVLLSICLIDLVKTYTVQAICGLPPSCNIIRSLFKIPSYEASIW